MTVSTDLSTLVGKAYTPAEQAAAIVTAINTLSGIKRSTIASGDDDATDSAIVQLSQKILTRKSQLEDSKIDNTNVPTIGKLVTDEIRDLLDDDSDDDDFIIGHSSPSETWEGI